MDVPLPHPLLNHAFCYLKIFVMEKHGGEQRASVVLIDKSIE